MRNARLDETQAGIKIPGKHINNLRYADDTTIMAESKEELKRLYESERGEWKSWLKTQHIQKTKMMAYGPITSGQIEGEKVKAITDFLILGSKITVDGDCNHKIKTLAPRKESYDKPWKCIKNQRYHFAVNGLYCQSYGFSRSHLWMWEFNHKEGWVAKNWCFWIVVLQKTHEESLGLQGDQSSQS